MEYHALYRKYRPRNFDEVVGQKVTIQILKNAIERKHISHAYLFYGPRGTGKTSIAKILSRTVNCENPKNGITCEKCDSCINSKENGCVDIIEIDAASNNGVDEIRELKNKISFVPSFLKYKVYIVDEVHMLSIGAFNALLKTLEEPPEHAIFILATTELQKVPLTIISRCQTLEFKKIDDKSMNDALKKIAEKENIQIDSNAINEIVRYSNGGMRDSIGLLEKASSYTNEPITEDIIKEISGNVSEKDLIDFISLLDKDKIEDLLNKIKKYYSEGIDLIKLTNNIIDYLRNQMIDKKTYDKNTCKLIIKLDELVSSMEKSENPKILFEASLIDYLLEDNNTKSGVKEQYQEDKTKIVEKSIEEPVQELNQNNHKEEKIISEDLKVIRVGNTLCAPNKEKISKIRSNWDKIKDLGFDDKYGNIARLLSSDVTPVAASETNVILISKLNGIANQINEEMPNIEKIFELQFNDKSKIVCLSEQEWKKYTDEYKQDKSKFVYQEEPVIEKKNKSLKEKAKELFED
jgi:DNA polymerase-3 subunit gamma/tau